MRQHRPSLLTLRAPRDTAQGCRIRKLYRTFIAKLDASNPEHQAMALTAAELTVAAEDARARLLLGDQSKEANDAVVRMENTARRARLDLKGNAKSIDDASDPYSDFLREQEEEAAKDSNK
jgi:hypothetical protein